MTYQARRASEEAAERADEDTRAARSFMRRPAPPSPGRSPSERERLEQQRQARADAAAQKAADARQKAADARQAALDEKTLLAAFGARVTAALGQARQELRQAVEACDYEAAITAAEKVGALEIVEIEMKRRGAAFAKSQRGVGYFRLDAGRV